MSHQDKARIDGKARSQSLIEQALPSSSRSSVISRSSSRGAPHKSMFDKSRAPAAEDFLFSNAEFV